MDNEKLFELAVFASINNDFISRGAMTHDSMAELQKVVVCNFKALREAWNKVKTEAASPTPASADCSPVRSHIGYPARPSSP